MLTGAQVRAARALARLSAEQLAAKAGVTRNTVLRIEATDDIPPSSVRTLLAIQRVLEEAGVEFVPGGAKLRASAHPKPEPRVLFFKEGTREPPSD